MLPISLVCYILEPMLSYLLIAGDSVAFCDCFSCNPIFVNANFN